MLSKGGRKRRQIIAAVAPVFNTKGFAATSISDALEAAEVEKGGLYFHFESKEKLAIAAFDYAASLVVKRRRLSQSGMPGALERLNACIRAVASSVKFPTLRGGCPIANAAVDSRDANPELRAHVSAAVGLWQTDIVRIVESGIVSGELRPESDPVAIASLFTSALQGALSISTVLDDVSHMERMAEHVRLWLRIFRARRRRTKKNVTTDAVNHQLNAD